MAGCMGTAALARTPSDMSYCTCSVHQKDEVELLQKRVDKLQGMLFEMRKAIA